MTADVKEFLRTINFLVIAQRDFPFMTGTFNGRFTREGPCPICGGKTRLRLRVDPQTGIQKLYCEGKCELHGKDAIGYLQWRDGVDFKTAWAELDGRVTTTPVPNWTPAPTVDHAPNSPWQNKAWAFVNGCADYLWSPAGAKALDYLRSRCLSDETIRRYKLGYNPTPKHARGMGWGLNENLTITAVAGITIPREILGDLWAINIRRMNPDGTPYKGADKYICVTGSKLGLWGADSLKDARSAIAFGGEFDAILASQHAPAGLAVVTFGGEGRSISQPWLNMLQPMDNVYVCMDNDGAGNNGSVKWAEVDTARRVRVPKGKDLTEYAQMGGDVSTLLANVTRAHTLTAWLPPSDQGEAVALADGLMTEIMGGQMADEAKALAWARWNCCRDINVVTSDDLRWIDLAQAID